MPNRSEEVQDIIERMPTRWCMWVALIIAHRLSTIRHAGQIVVMHQGEIAEIGTHKELMQRRGYYAELVASQADKLEQSRS
jgi:ABC transporter, ATP-binding protein